MQRRAFSSALAVLVSFVTLMTVAPAAVLPLSAQAATPKAVPARPPATGWVGEKLVSPGHDDWEPAIAADPTTPYVYRLVTRFGDPACPVHCPSAAIVLQVSADGGVHWGPGRYLCRCSGAPWQADPQIEVASVAGTVEAAFLNGYHVWFTESSDHGRTWSKAVSVMGSVRWGDKPVLATNPGGHNVFIAFNGPTDGDAYVAVSRDSGHGIWHQHLAIDSKRYTYAFGGLVFTGGTVVFSESILQYASDGDHLMGVNEVATVTSTDGGQTWTKKRVATLQLGRPCTSAGCPGDFYDGHTAVASDGGSGLLLLSDGALRAGGVRRVYSWFSPDKGHTWDARQRLSLNSAEAGFPAAVGRNGEFRIWFMDHRTGKWNVMYRTSTDGRNWTDSVRLSNAIGGAPYKNAHGFDEVYGDYGEIDITNTGKTVATWGEGSSYDGPGGCWFARQV
jgi:hypothetical protein